MNSTFTIQTIFNYSIISTPLGSMLAFADEEALYILKFTNDTELERDIKKLQIKTKSSIIAGENKIITLLKKELSDYFTGVLTEFTVPIYLSGTPFQKSAWNALLQIPFGQTRSYKQQARFVGNESASRAIGTANGSNLLAIIIPCHRVINNNGNLGGYASGIERKQWLLEHEKQVALQKAL